MIHHGCFFNHMSDANLNTPVGWRVFLTDVTLFQKDVVSGRLPRSFCGGFLRLLLFSQLSMCHTNLTPVPSSLSLRFLSLQVWKLAGHGLMHSFSTEHAKQSIFRNIGAGVMQVETRPGNRIFTCGADGTLKMRVLPDRYNIPSSLVDVL